MGARAWSWGGARSPRLAPWRPATAAPAWVLCCLRFPAAVAQRGNRAVAAPPPALDVQYRKSTQRWEREKVPPKGLPYRSCLFLVVAAVGFPACHEPPDASAAKGVARPAQATAGGVARSAHTSTGWAARP